MLISVKNGAADMIFFHQKMRNWYWGNYKKKGEKNLYPFKKEAQKNEIMGPSGPPLMHVSVYFCLT